jgi:hypothetical protein
MTERRRRPLRNAIRIGFIVWALVAMSWLANSIRTRGVDEATLRSSPSVAVHDDASELAFLPASPHGHAALVFMCGSGITAEAYAPLLRPVAEQGFPVFIVKLPYRFAPRASDKEAAIGRARAVITAHPDVKHWVIAGHSLGAALAARMARTDSASLSAVILVATTHPKADDLSALRLPVTKIYASNDGIAPPDRIFANKGLLPSHTKWVEIRGGNHSQFGRYGHQLFDGTATIGRETQESLTRSAILRVLADVGSGD